MGLQVNDANFQAEVLGAIAQVPALARRVAVDESQVTWRGARVVVRSIERHPQARGRVAAPSSPGFYEGDRGPGTDFAPTGLGVSRAGRRPRR